MNKKIGLAVVPLAAAAALALGGVAQASVGPVQFTPAGANSISGYYAHAENDTVNFTHLATREGGDGSHTIEQLPVTTATGHTIGTVGGAAGIALCNQTTGNAAQLGLVYVSGGLVDVVYATGTFPAAPVNNNDKCQGGLVNPSGAKYLAGPFPDNNSVDLDILYDAANPHPAFRGHSFAKGTIIFSATNLGAPGVSYLAGVLSPGKAFNEADAGVVADTQTLVPLGGVPPYPYNGHNSDPSELEGFSHTLADGNSVLPGGTETHGTFYSNPAWGAFPVASNANGKTYLGPTQFVDDGFLELVGSPVSSPPAS